VKAKIVCLTQIRITEMKTTLKPPTDYEFVIKALVGFKKGHNINTGQETTSGI
jgi:hypothetical protein